MQREPPTRATKAGKEQSAWLLGPRSDFLREPPQKIDVEAELGEKPDGVPSLPASNDT